jgi:hypothetical protein
MGSCFISDLSTCFTLSIVHPEVEMDRVGRYNSIYHSHGLQEVSETICGGGKSGFVATQVPEGWGLYYTTSVDMKACHSGAYTSSA